MKKFTYFCKSNLLNITLLLKLHLFWSLSDNHYGDCLPERCGNLDIRYPFHLLNQQSSYCGLPGFEVSCNINGIALFKMSGDTYVIKNIWYESDKFQVVSSALLNTSGCWDSIKNFSLKEEVFSFTSQNSKVYLFRNCSQKVVEENRDNRVKCGGVAVRENDPKLKNLEKECKGLVMVPYSDEGVSNGTIIGNLENGMLLKYRAYNCTACRETGGQCGHDVINNQFNCYCRDRTHALHCNHKKNELPLKLGLGVATATLLGAALVALAINCEKRRRKATYNDTGLWTKVTRRNQNVEAFLKNYGSLAPTRYSYAEIIKITKNFKERIGEGGYGTVYKGELRDGRIVAVKNLKKLDGDDKDFINEVVSIGRTNHVNVVTLLGFCFEGKKRALVYEFLPNGSLERFIYNARSDQSLSSETLFSIAVDIAKGLDYLHRGCNTRILHFDIKPHNILLDEELRPKISDFGLARLCATEGSLVSMTEARGTIGYIAPEVFCRNFGGVSHKSDVYSYGMMLLDLVCGRKNAASVAQSTNSESYFPDWIYNQLEFEGEIEVHGIRNCEANELHKKMILVGLWCIQSYPSQRPPINRVIEMLEGPLEAVQVPPKTHLASPPHSVFDSSGTCDQSRVLDISPLVTSQDSLS